MVMTTVTCIYVITKVFLFHWTPVDGDKKDHNNVICYVLLVVSFILAWVETWFLDFQVLPKERREIQRYGQILPPDDDRGPLLRSGTDRRLLDTEQDVFASLPHSRDDSGDESQQSPPFRSVANSRHHSRQPSRGSSSGFSLGGNEKDYLEVARECWDKAWEIHEDERGWKVEKGEGLDDGRVSFKQYPDMGKVFKLEAYVDCSVQELFDELVVYNDDTPKWNPTVTESRIIQVIDDSTDIQYTVAAEAAGGLVSSRDFVNLRHWKSRNGVTLSSGCGVTHPDTPKSNKHVRGHNRPGGWFFKPVAGRPDRCIFCWIMNTDIKGWLPQWTVDQALSGTLVNFLRHVRTRVADKKNPASLQV